MDSELYKPDIEDARIDLRARIFRECEAMAAYMASRGFPASETIKDRIGILDVGIGRRAEIPMGALFDLHGALSEIIKPAIPRTVELLHWDAHQNRWWNKLAPVSAIRHLLGATAFFLALFFLAVAILAGNEEAIRAGLFSAGSIGEILSVTLFLGTLAGLGACFSVLYDARKYVVEGTYDPRIGSNYAIRILLGVVSGILLAQIMLDQVMAQESEARAIYGAPLLALLGGFASQFVYTVLNKLVDAAGSVFEQERAAEMKARERAIIIESQEKSSREQVLRTVAAVGLAAELDAADTPEKRKTVIDRLIRTASGTPAMEGVAQGAGAGLAALDKSAAAVAFGRTVVDLLPPERAQRARAALDTIEAQIRDARVMARVLRSGDLVGEAARIAADLARTGPLRIAFSGTLGAFAGPLLAAGLKGATPLGVALALARATATQGSEAYARWKTRILDADYAPDLLAPEHLDAAAVRAALSRSPDFAAGFASEMDDMAALNDLGRQVANESDAALLGRYGDRFASPEAFTAALRSFRRALLDPPVQKALDPEIVAASGAEDAETLIAAIDALRADPAARDEVERLFLLASATRGEDEDAAERRRELVEAIMAAGGQGTAEEQEKKANAQV